MTSLVIGASGQVGAQLYRLCRSSGECVGTYCHHAFAHGEPLDLRDAAAVEKLIRRLNPDACYLPAAMTHVDQAEECPEECLAINVEGVRAVAKAVAQTDARLVFFSTDHVFGERDEPWREDEPPAPLSVYARSKRLAEQLVADLLPGRHLILRTSWVFGPDPNGKNFVYQVRAALQEKGAMNVPLNQFGQPTYGPDLALAAVRLVERRHSGIYHVVGPAWLSKLKWASLIAKASGLPVALIEGVSALRQAAPRPGRVRLCRDKLLQTLGTDPIRHPSVAAGFSPRGRTQAEACGYGSAKN